MSRPKTPDGVLIEAHRRLSDELGRPPTGIELGKAARVSHVTAENRMRALGLKRSILRNKRIPDSTVLDAHAQLTDALGRAPTSTELGRRIGLSEPGAADRMRTLGLARTHMTRSEAGRIGADIANGKKRARRKQEDKTPEAPIRAKDMFDAYRDAERARKQRYYAAWRGEGAQDGNQGEVHGLAGAGYAPGERAKIRCAICARERIITPRTHPWYMRDSSGAVRWLCSEQCMRGVDV